MDSLTTTRLELIPLDEAQLALAASDWQALEATLGLAPGSHALSPPEKRAIASKRRKLAANPEAIGWLTYWLLVERKNRQAAGMCGFKGMPAAGEVEVGYGTFPRHRGRGYMTEALATLLSWALAEMTDLRVLAETAPDNRPSQRVLEKVGFTRLREREASDAIWWVYE